MSQRRDKHNRREAKRAETEIMANMKKEKEEKAKRHQLERQYFNRIRSFEARDGNIIIRVKPDPDPSGKGKALRNQIWGFQEAIYRLRQLNAMIHVIPEADRDTAYAIVDEGIRVVQEAKEQIQAGKHKPVIMTNAEGYTEDQLNALFPESVYTDWVKDVKNPAGVIQ
jgi:hypothetical protein